MNKRIEGLVARKGGARPVADTAIASFLAFPAQDEPHYPVQATLAGVRSAKRHHAREIVGAIPDQFT